MTHRSVRIGHGSRLLLALLALLGVSLAARPATAQPPGAAVLNSGIEHTCSLTPPGAIDC